MFCFCFREGWQGLIYTKPSVHNTGRGDLELLMLRFHLTDVTSPYLLSVVLVIKFGVSCLGKRSTN